MKMMYCVVVYAQFGSFQVSLNKGIELQQVLGCGEWGGALAMLLHSLS